MNTKKLIFLLLVCITAISGCADNVPLEVALIDGVEVDKSADGSQDSVNSEPDASALYDEFIANGSYTQWSLWPGTESMMEGNAIEGDYISIYVSDSGRSAIELGAPFMPYDTIVLKEAFNAEKELISVHIMYKAEGFDHEHNDWFWASYSADGKVKHEGSVAGCLGCHKGKRDSDFLFTNV